MNENCSEPTLGLLVDNNVPVALPIDFNTVAINKGASFFISRTLYLAVASVIGSLESCFFFNNKYVSKSNLFLSDEGNDSHTFPSVARKKGSNPN